MTRLFKQLNATVQSATFVKKLVVLTVVILFFFWSAQAALANNIEQSWPFFSCVSESPTIEGSPHLTELMDSNGVPNGKTLLTYFQRGTDGQYKIAYRVSDNGVDWSSQRYIPGTDDGLDPSAVQLPNGEVLVVYSHYLSGIDDVHVNITRSQDLVTWSQPQPLVSPEGVGNAFVPSITVLRDGRVMIVYSFGYEQVWSDLYYIESLDNGLSWSAPKLIYSGPNYDSKADLIELNNGDLLTAFYTSRPFPNGSGIVRRGDILAVRSSDGGAHWQTPVSISVESDRDECWVSLLERSEGQVLAALTVDEGDRDAGNPPSIQLVKSYDGGITWGDNKTLDDDNRRLTWPALAQRSDGSALLLADDNAWYDFEHRSYWSLWQWNTKTSLSLSTTDIYWGNLAEYRAGLLSVDFAIESIFNDSAVDIVDIEIQGSISSNGVSTSTPTPATISPTAPGEWDFTIRYSVPAGVGSFHTMVYATAQDALGNSYEYPEPWPGV